MTSGYTVTTLDGQNENMIYVRRSYMYEFIILIVVAIIVLSITIRNLTSDSVTAAGSIICWIILILFVIAVVFYVGNLFGGSYPQYSSPSYSRNDAGTGGPVIRIHYV
jgi:glucan phosphoethanolaminetransferase (alkaline phosphatase superfamily)